MEIAHVHKEEIEQIVAAVDCPKNLECYRSAFERLSKVEIMADGKVIQCLEENSRACQLGFLYGAKTVFCLCPLRSYIARNFHK